MSTKKKNIRIVGCMLFLVITLVGQSWGEERLGLSEWIVYSSDRAGSWDIWLVSIDGKKEINLTKGNGSNGDPRFTPDGERIIFQSNRTGNWEIFTMAVDGSGVERITNHLALDVRPIYSPDGTKIYFISTRDGAPQIYVMNADGGDQRPLTSGPHTNNGHDVSFDGTRVAFQSNRSGNWEIYTMTADGSDVRQLTDNPAADMVPRFAPNGKIVFQSGRDMLSYQHPAHQIYMMNYDGSALIALTQAGIPNSGCRIQEIGNVTPAPTRDGSRIVFLSTASWKRCGQDIFVMDANGKNPRQITYLGIFQGVRGPELSHVPFAITVK